MLAQRFAKAMNLVGKLGAEEKNGVGVKLQSPLVLKI